MLYFSLTRRFDGITSVVDLILLFVQKKLKARSPEPKQRCIICECEIFYRGFLAFQSQQKYDSTI